MKTTVVVNFPEGSSEIKIGDGIFFVEARQRHRPITVGETMIVTAIGRKYFTAAYISGNSTYGSTDFVIDGAQQKSNPKYNGSGQAYCSADGYAEYTMKRKYISDVQNKLNNTCLTYSEAQQIAKILNFKE